MISRSIKNATFEVFDLASGSEDHFEVAAVRAVPSGFLAHLTDQASRNDDSQSRRKFAPWLFPYSIYVPRMFSQRFARGTAFTGRNQEKVTHNLATHIVSLILPFAQLMSEVTSLVAGGLSKEG
jgi:hypothetical protein